MISSKGGSGKTVMTATFATFLTALGKKVLIIDTDASTNGLTLMYLKEVTIHEENTISQDRKPLGIYELDDLINDIPEIVQLPTGVHLIPATYSFKNTEDTSLKTFSDNLKHYLRNAEQEYNYIFLDAQAGSDKFAHACMAKNVAHEVVIVSEYDPLSAAGVERLKALFRDDLTYNRTWVLLNKMLPDFVKSFSDFLEVAKYLSPIPWDAEVVKAYARRRLALNMEYGNEFTVAVLHTLKTLFAEELESELNTWLNDKANLLKEPLNAQYEDLRRQLRVLYGLKSKPSGLSFRRVANYISPYSFRFLSIAILLILFIILTNSYLTNKSITAVFEKNNDIILMAILALSAIMTYSTLYHGRWRENDESVYSREISRLEEKITKIDSLRSANLEDLIKQNKKLNTSV